MLLIEVSRKENQITLKCECKKKKTVTIFILWQDGNFLITLEKKVVGELFIPATWLLAGDWRDVVEALILSEFVQLVPLDALVTDISEVRQALNHQSFPTHLQIDRNYLPKMVKFYRKEG